MKYIALDIDGWLGGTCARFLKKSEKAVWSDLLVLGGKGKGRFGFIEQQKGMGYTRQQLLVLCTCFTPEDIESFDSCMKKCIDGALDETGALDAPRLAVHENGVYEIINWDKYQHSDYPKGYTEEEAKALKKQQRIETAEKLPIESETSRAIKATKLIKEANAIHPQVAEQAQKEINRNRILRKQKND